MASFTVISTCKVSGRVCKPGETVDGTLARLQPLLDSGSLVRVDEPKGKAAKSDKGEGKSEPEEPENG